MNKTEIVYSLLHSTTYRNISTNNEQLHDNEYYNAKCYVYFSINKYTQILVPNTYLTKILIPQTQICEPQIYSIVGNSDTNPN